MSDHSSPQAAPNEGAASPRLRDVLAAHQPYGLEPGWADTVAAAWREACTIRTLEQLDLLPDGSVIRWDRGPFEEPQVLERCVVDWLEPGNDCSEPHGAHLIPALLLWHPEWSDQ
ncbi:hypothetical protein [Mycobacteroides abscessus]|uniref:hypothetical protein n=1 Tax=Mycobacteroides abscessus TaxID=36809 RepID=UPI00210414B5|nr:hypothetical protein [Mycobacteroides abscessus]